jgi:hypothetical protein
MAEYSSSVIDIREQYPLLPRGETISIARELGIDHPCYPDSDTPTVMTTDLVLTVLGVSSREILPLSLKYASEPTPDGDDDEKYKRTIEKLRSKTILVQACPRWLLCTEKLLPLNRVQNLDALRTAVITEECDWLNPLLPEFVRAFRAVWSDRKRLKDIHFETAVQLQITQTDSAVLFGRAV